MNAHGVTLTNLNRGNVTEADPDSALTISRSQWPGGSGDILGRNSRLDASAKFEKRFLQP